MGRQQLLKMVIDNIVSVILVLNVLVVISVLRVREYGSESIDFQIIIKLTVWALCLGVALLFWRRWGPRLLKIDNALLYPMFAIMIYSCTYAPSLGYSLGAVFSMISVILFAYVCSDLLGEERMLYATFTATSIVCVISIVMYFVNPEMSRMKEWVGAELVLGARMSGLTPTANSMGLTAGFGFILLFYYYYYYGRKIFRLDLMLMGVPQLIALFMSDSRTSVIALVLAIVSVYFLSPRIERWFVLLLGILFLALFLYIADIEYLLSLISRSGDAEEIMTGTGRTHIWETALHLIHEHPFTGYGYASTTFILPQYASEIGHVPSTTHNIFLQILFNMGYPALFVFLLIFAVKFYYALRYQDVLKLSLMMFILIGGLTEPSIFRGVAGMSALMFAMVMGMKYKTTEDRMANRKSISSIKRLS